MFVRAFFTFALMMTGAFRARVGNR